MFADVLPDPDVVKHVHAEDVAIWIGIALLVVVIVGSKIYLALVEDDHDDG